MRLRRRPGVEKELLKMPGFLGQDAVFLRGSWSELFGNNQPLYVELGMGKGQFITTLAQQYPGLNFIGLERVPELIYQVMQKEVFLSNLCLLHADVTQLDQFFLPGEITRIYLNFSDPWPKRRHETRRLTSCGFLKIYKNLLKKEGEIHFKTDSLAFFEYSLKQFVVSGFSLQQIVRDLHHSGFTDNVLTEYELKFKQKGSVIYRCEALKN